MVRSLDPRVWQACAGTFVQIPTVKSRVYYFPQGHLDEATFPPQNLSSLLLSTPYIICTVSAVQFLPDAITEEVFTNLMLHPLGGDFTAANADGDDDNVDDYVSSSSSGDYDYDDDDDRFASFAKILTPSDVGGGGFSVPTSCANAIFPDFENNFENIIADRREQPLKFKDLHGKAWRFRHSYEVKTKRHFLTTGWSKFVDNKKLVVGDSIVFIKRSETKMFIGFRRASSEFSLYSSDTSCYHKNPSSDGRIPHEAVADAAELAARKMPFQVVYYPRAGWSDFVLRAEDVEKALNVVWRPGMRVKIGVEMDNSFAIAWFKGIVSSLVLNGKHPWQGSPWRILQIAWGESELLKNYRWVSPWQIQVVTPALPTEGIANVDLDDSFTGMKLLDRLHAQCQSASIVEET